jgi:hypothetical protein
MPHAAGKVRVEIVDPQANTADVSADQKQEAAGTGKTTRILLRFGSDH